MNWETKHNYLESITQAILMGQKEYDFNGVMVALPTPQRAGSLTQQQTYARLQAMAIVEIFSDKSDKSEKV
tara:strand:- start:302 stop:514 length:213 start_codon:yes stop_codon:yes gene_type:complete